MTPALAALGPAPTLCGSSCAACGGSVSDASLSRLALKRVVRLFCCLANFTLTFFLAKSHPHTHSHTPPHTPTQTAHSLSAPVWTSCPLPVPSSATAAPLRIYAHFQSLCRRSCLLLLLCVVKVMSPTGLGTFNPLPSPG